MSIDPYATPAATGQMPGSLSQSAITKGVVDQLARTKPWVRLISVVLFIGVGFMLLAGLVMVVGGAAMFSNIPASGNSPGGSPALPAAMFTGMAIAYIIFGILYLYPGVKLWKYANRIGDLVRSGQSADLESALNEQRAFWKFFGVIIVLMLALYGVIIVVAVVGGVIGASQG
jgi:hypothetical protein